jgi:PIN domain nuclease of toxin-antitoxin system
MRILLDTHAVVWYLDGNEKLQPNHRHLIVDSRNDLFVSTASLWELAIKISIGRLETPRSLSDILAALQKQGFEVLPVMPGHTLQITALPLHHRDPFDRMLIAQALVEHLSLLTYDIAFKSYGVKLL